VISHKIYVERDGERTQYAETNTVKKARALVPKAKRELGIAKDLHSRACCEPIQRSNGPLPWGGLRWRLLSVPCHRMACMVQDHGKRPEFSRRLIASIFDLIECRE
jgi:hypothetical protein